MLSSGLFVSVIIYVALLVVHLRMKAAKSRRLPPGPPPTPVFGNVRGFDTSYPWKSYAKWGKEYGDIIYTRLLTQEIIVINSEKVAQDLLTGRSQNYSDRPAGIRVMVDLVGNSLGAKFTSIFLPYGDLWRLHRKIFHQAINQSAAQSFRPLQLQKAHNLIMHLVSNTPNYSEHLQVFSVSTIMSIVYDYEASGKDDPMVAIIERALEIGHKETRPDLIAMSGLRALLMGYTFPKPVKHIPTWFPGADFKRKALIFRRTIAGWVETPFEYVRNSMAEGTANPSMVSDALLRVRDGTRTEAGAAYLEQVVKEACATAYIAASETTHSTLMVFILAMILYPDVQAQAQAEIDSVIGVGLPRLPYWDDRLSLPYVEAVVKETLRWHPVVPLGIPHAAIDDDIYEGYNIPRGATVIANAWAMSQDPVSFPEPEKFKPERFLGEKTRSVDQLSFAFGFGRRVCVGRYVADASVWISIVSMLAVFRFEAPPSWDPGPDGVNVEWTSGFSSVPKDVPCITKPRHENVSPEKLAHLVERVASSKL